QGLRTEELIGIPWETDRRAQTGIGSLARSTGSFRRSLLPAHKTIRVRRAHRVARLPRPSKIHRPFDQGGSHISASSVLCRQPSFPCRSARPKTNAASSEVPPFP